MKHEAFAEEKEWRLIVSNAPVATMRFRAGYANIKPYVELSLPMKDDRTIVLSLKQVIYGPTRRTEDSPQKIVEWMLQASGYTNVDIDSCNIPYRL